ncbi:MAG: ABC transporter substrate-binding protein [Cryomorphaceae bacterium]|nr:ABC transporter substrate-binding protein [Cryomorphaceae bacterium]
MLSSQSMKYSWLLFLILVFTRCSDIHDDSEKAVFTYNESNGITSLDPAFTRNLENMWAVNQLFDGLVELDDALHIQPLIARSWSISDDGLTYLFNLRSDVFFHDDACFVNGAGRRLTAQDVDFSFRRLLDDGLASPGRWIFDPVAENGFEVVNDSTFQIHLNSPFPPFLGMLTTQYAGVVPHEAITMYGDDFRSHPVGSGPFKFAFWMEDVALVFHKNPNFWQRDEHGAQLPFLDAVKIEFVRDMNAEFLGLLQGQFDFMSGIHAAYKDELLTQDGELQPAYQELVNFQRSPFIKTDYIGVLVDDSLPFSANHPLNDVRIRRALNMSVDRAAMVRYLRNNSVYEAVNGFVPPGMAGFENPEVLVEYDLELARQYMADAGFPNGEGLPVIPLSTTSDYVDIIEFLQHQWRKIGIEISVDVLAGPAQREQVSSSNALLFRKSWLADYADAENFLGTFISKNFCPNGANYTHYGNAKYDELYSSAAQAKTDSARFAIYREMNGMIANDVPVIPLFYDQVSHFIRKDVSDFSTNAINMLDLKRTKKGVK